MNRSLVVSGDGKKERGCIHCAPFSFPSATSPPCQIRWWWCGGWKKEGVRQWTCPDCGAIHDRDVNAARNLLALGLAALSRPTASSAGCEACGEDGADVVPSGNVKPASAKQEVSFEPV
ncbi:zinc ribbon domain-containing protein [Acidithiobacillus caldus]|uniref:zinc ribbon domain-containing protein n=1 Tax=Acidithiobacillus caldus TaxID=33059 RepID=UPI001D019EED|nr:zinc ribbon domain-containing protein [Acidithiobacillus caldus]